MNELRNKIDILTKKFSEKTKIINKVLENFEVYYNLTENLINSFERKYLNYYILNSINNITEYNEKIIKDVDKILNEKNPENINN